MVDEGNKISFVDSPIGATDININLMKIVE